MLLVTKGLWAEEIVDSASLTRLQKDFCVVQRNASNSCSTVW